ncbi:MAG: SIR2 family protein [Deltaproteobacteria bacterium]|nr:SIR2 family protein [Deltaproteobacteria bacterium]
MKPGPTVSRSPIVWCKSVVASPHLNYIKLHGSIKVQENGKDVLLFGGKTKNPEEFNYTNLNFEIFSECLKHCKRIFFIGFSFHDNGIVKKIENAINKDGNYNLQFVIINPEPQYKFLDQFKNKSTTPHPLSFSLGSISSALVSASFMVCDFLSFF